MTEMPGSSPCQPVADDWDPQAMITAAFSIIRQSMSLGCFPRMKIVQTNTRIRGQIYIPEINYVLMVLSIAAVGGFQTLDRIGSAYGEARSQCFLFYPKPSSLVQRAPPRLCISAGLSRIPTSLKQTLLSGLHSLAKQTA